jgi:hypothetical protein
LLRARARRVGARRVKGRLVNLEAGAC